MKKSLVLAKITVLMDAAVNVDVVRAYRDGAMLMNGMHDTKMNNRIERDLSLIYKKFHWLDDDGNWNIGQQFIDETGELVFGESYAAGECTCLMKCWPEGSIKFVQLAAMKPYPASPIPTP